MLAVALPLSVSAEKKPIRTLQYFPEGRDIVCVNGDNRYTRALYGNYTTFRLETSDRPIFATYDGKKSKNFRLYVNYKGQTLRLDSTSYCEARYQGGRRSYVVKDSRWGDDAEMQIVSLASREKEGALWKFVLKGFSGKVSFKCLMAPVKKWKMTRTGDLGLEPRSSYEASDVDSLTKTISWNGENESYLVFDNPDIINVCSLKEGRKRMEQEEKALSEISSCLEFTTPDPFINTLGANLAVASDGLWDGETWLHGCIGWRMQLAGWRAAYLADALGWFDKAEKHFNAYAKSQVTNVDPIYPHPSQDSAANLCRAVEKWGTQMYSNGYICRSPNNNKKMHHYDMNLNYIDELLWHFSYDADTASLRRMWPVIKLHLEWEKRNWDADNDHLYDAYCCIWASDALYYNGGAVTHSSAYNYRGNLLAARIADILGEDSKPYRDEAEAIKKAMNERLWVETEGHWAEFQDLMGTKRVHNDAALWSVYTPIDCGVGTPMQDYLSTAYVDNYFNHIPVEFNIPEKYKSRTSSLSTLINGKFSTISTSDWMPYDWSTNNVAHEEVMNMALAYFEAGRSDSGYNLLMSDLLDEQYLGQCPGNFGQISYYDKARSEAYRDFGDNIGITARAVVNGLFGVLPDALNGKCVVKPAWPEEWDSVTFKSPYLVYNYKRKGTKDIYEIHQNFPQPLQIVIKAKMEEGQFMDFVGTSDSFQVIIVDHELMKPQEEVLALTLPIDISTPEYMEKMGLTESSAKGVMMNVNISKYFNSSVSDIFKNEYLSPRSPYTTLEIPKQGIGQWCIPKRTATIDDKGYREKIESGVFNTGVEGVSFLSPETGDNIVYTSLWDNYPDSVVIPLKGQSKSVWLMLAGSTNSMQSRIANGVVTVTYKDGTTDEMMLENPVNWCPIEQDYYVDEFAFHTSPLRPYRIHLGSGKVARELGKVLTLKGIGNSYNKNPDSAEGNIIPDGAAEMLRMPLNPNKKLKSLTLRTLSNDVVIGLMGVTLEK